MTNFTEETATANAVVDYERANPLPGRHVARWARIKEIQTDLKSRAALEAAALPKKRKPTFDQSPEWETLATELRALHDIERTHALAANWPIWQSHQHCDYLNEHGTLRQAEVIAFDLDTGTIECSTWEPNDILGYLGVEGKRLLTTITPQQIHAAEDYKQAARASRREQDAAASLLSEQTRLPLFAEQLTLE
jgi:hypothetical protein